MITISHPLLARKIRVHSTGKLIAPQRYLPPRANRRSKIPPPGESQTRGCLKIPRYTLSSRIIAEPALTPGDFARIDYPASPGASAREAEVAESLKADGARVSVCTGASGRRRSHEPRRGRSRREREPRSLGSSDRQQQQRQPEPAVTRLSQTRARQPRRWTSRRSSCAPG